MDNWQIDFNYHDIDIDCDVILSGNAQAIAIGLQLAIATVKDKMEALIKSSKPPLPLLSDMLILGELQKGNIREYSGEYLKIVKVNGKSKGLFTSISIEWGD